MNAETMSFSRIRKGVLLRIFYKEKGMGGVPIPFYIFVYLSVVHQL